MFGHGEPLKIHELDISGLVDEFAKRNIRTTTSKIQKLHPAQLEIINDPARFKVLACGRRFGKSFFCTIIAAAVAMQGGRKIWIVGDSYSITDKVFQELYHLFVNELKLATVTQGGRASLLNRYIRLPNGSVIEGKSCENRNSLVGDSIDLLIWDESALTINGKDIWDQELRPTLMDREGSAIFISTPRGRNHFYEWYDLGKRGRELRQKIEASKQTEDEKSIAEWSGFKFSSYCNTIDQGGYLKRSEIDAARISTPNIKFRQEYMADFTAISDSVFPEFNAEVQKVTWEHKPNLPIQVGMDFNYQTPCTTLYLQVYDNQDIFVFDEFFPEQAHVTVHEQAEQLLESDGILGNKIDVIAADVAGKQMNLDGRSAWDDLADYNIFPIGTKQKIETGCDLIRLLCSYPKFDNRGLPVLDEQGNTVTYPKLFIHERCKNLIFALETARAPEGHGGLFKEGYRKDGRTDGPLDALRYILVELMGSVDSVALMPVL